MIKPYNITRTTYKVSQLISLLKAEELDLSPNFQRRAVWSPGAKSFLIDTIIRGLPIPIIFLREKVTDLKTLKSISEVVDGQQRLRTVVSFIAPNLLKDFVSVRDEFLILSSHNKELGKKNYQQLDSVDKQRILDYQFSAHVFPADVSDGEIYEIFARMNSSGYKLNDQELRNARYFGEFKSLMYKLGAQQLERWRNWGIFTEDRIARMNEVELTSEFAQMMFIGIAAKNQKSIDRMYESKDDFFPEASVVEKRFEETMDEIDKIFGLELKESPFSRRTLFYILFAYTYDHLFGLKSKLKKTKPKSPSKFVAMKLKKFSNAIKTGAATKEIIDIAGRRTTNLKTRKALLDYLTKGV